MGGSSRQSAYCAGQYALGNCQVVVYAIHDNDPDKATKEKVHNAATVSSRDGKYKEVLQNSLYRFGLRLIDIAEYYSGDKIVITFKSM
jgi:hypothetical protein